LINEVEVINENAFKEYAPKVGQALQAAGAKTLARGGTIEPLAGDPPKRAVVLMFESLEKAEAWRENWHLCERRLPRNEISLSRACRTEPPAWVQASVNQRVLWGYARMSVSRPKADLKMRLRCKIFLGCSIDNIPNATTHALIPLVVREVDR
jgi:uncharacterized protein (DUF1330 family)